MTELLYSGKAKDILITDSPDKVIMKFRNSLTAFNGKKKAELEGKGKLNCEITVKLFKYLESKGIKTCFIEQVSDSEIFCKKTKVIPLEVVVRNIATGSIVKRFGLKKGMRFQKPLLEFFLKDDELNDPSICRSHIVNLGFADEEILDKLTEESIKVNSLLQGILSSAGIDLVDFKLEFGDTGSEIILIDEITPDTCRFWDKNTKESLDKDIFRQDNGDVIKAYSEVLNRLNKLEDLA